jgi:hypothetical protein
MINSIIKYKHISHTLQIYETIYHSQQKFIFYFCEIGNFSSFYTFDKKEVGKIIPCGLFAMHNK